MYKPSKGQSTRVEVRSLDAACNPYLAFAVLLAAGLKGIEEGYELPAGDRGRRLEPHRLRAPGHGHRAAAVVARPGARGDGGERARRRHPRRARLRLLPAQQAAGVGGLPQRGHPVRARPLPARASDGPPAGRVTRLAPSDSTPMSSRTSTTEGALARLGFADPARAERAARRPGAAAGLATRFDDGFSSTASPRAIGRHRRPGPGAARPGPARWRRSRASCARRRPSWRHRRPLVRRRSRRPGAGARPAARRPRRRPPPWSTTSSATPSTGVDVAERDAAAPASGCAASSSRAVDRRARRAHGATTPCASPTGASCCASPRWTSPPPDPLGDDARPSARPWPSWPRRPSRPRSPSPARSTATAHEALPARGHRHGQDRRRRAQLRQRRRRHLRRRAGRRRRRGHARSRVATALATAHDARLLDADAGGHLWPVDAALRPEGKQRPAGAHHRQPPGVLRALGQDLGVPGAAQGVGRRPGTWSSGRPTRPRSRRMVWEAAGRDNFVEDVQAMRRRVEQHVPGRRGRRASSSSGRAACATSSSACSCSSSCTGAADESLRSATTLEALAALARGGYVGREDAADPRRGLPAAAHASSTGSSCTGCAAPTSCRSTRPTCAGSAAPWGTGRNPSEAVVAELAAPRPARCAGSTSGSSTGRCSPPPPSSARPRRALTPGGRPGAARRARLPRPGRRDAPHRGADHRGQPARRDPAHPAAGDARLVRRRGRPRRRAAGLPRGSARSSARPTGTSRCSATRVARPSGSPTAWPAAGMPPTCWCARRRASRSSATTAG